MLWVLSNNVVFAKVPDWLMIGVVPILKRLVCVVLAVAGNLFPVILAGIPVE